MVKASVFYTWPVSTTAIFLAFIALLSVGLTWGFIRYACKARLLDIPNERSSHQVPVVRGGGVAFIVSFYVGLTLIYALGVIELTSFGGLILGGAWVVLAGLWDDVGSLAMPWRLAFQGIGVGIGLALLDVLFPAGSHDGWSIPFISLCFVGWLWLINLYNFMDGIDGLAASEALIVGVGAVAQLIFIEPQSALILPFLILAAAVLGFYPFNRTPARVFMGDAGSSFLGFILGALALMTVLADALTIYSWLILLAAFWVDATWTLGRRILTRQAWYRPHCSHSYQQLAKRGYRHLQVTSRLMWINIAWLWPLSTLSLIYSDFSTLLLGIAVVPLELFCFWIKAGANESRPS